MSSKDKSFDFPLVLKWNWYWRDYWRCN